MPASPQNAKDSGRHRPANGKREDSASEIGEIQTFGVRLEAEEAKDHKAGEISRESQTRDATGRRFFGGFIRRSQH
jgi:hypothetical protein